MSTWLVSSFCLLAMVLGVGNVSAAVTDNSADWFETKVRPVLAKNCYACHTQAKMGGLRLDSRQAVLAGGKRGTALIPGDPEKSLLILAVRNQGDVKMPPQGPMSPAEVAMLEEWVRRGAVWPEPTRVSAPGALWSLEPVRKPVAPQVNDGAWPKTAVDRFILAKLESSGLKPSRRADARTLLRRVTYDLTGLPPSPEEVEAFVKDDSQESYARAVDRLLASPRYGERWARMWLDIARYSNDVMFGPAPNFAAYRDWVIRSLNEDLPYDVFVKAHFAADLLDRDDKQKLLPALTMFVDTQSEFADDDRVDVFTRGFLGLTVACARCHDHKYDPIPTKDFYALMGIFRSTRNKDIPLAPGAEVAAYQARKKMVDEQKAAIKDFLETESRQLVEVLAAQTERHLIAASKVLGRKQTGVAAAAAELKLDEETLGRWVEYLKLPSKQQPYFRKWEKLVSDGASDTDIQAESRAIERLLVQTLRDKKAVDEYNKVVSYGIKTGRMLGDIVGRTMDRPRYMLWQEMAAEGNPRANEAVPDARVDGVLYYKGEKGARFYPESWRAHLAGMREELTRREAEMPPAYPYLTVIEDVEKPENLKIHIRGNAQNLGEEAPRGFLTSLKPCMPQGVPRGSGRLELAQAMTSPLNPLTPRVVVNRIWEGYFAQGIVRSLSNFGMTGDRPTHPDLLDYLAARLVESKWSLKAIHREIALSAVYQESSDANPEATKVDSDNRLLWRHNRRRLDVESLRDSVLAVNGRLDVKYSGAPQALDAGTNRARTIYGKVSRHELNSMLALFDFPNPNLTSEQRVQTTVPLQRLFLLNSEWLMAQSAELAKAAKQAGGDDVAEQITAVYRIVYQRQPSTKEFAAAAAFLSHNSWERLAQVLLSTNEFLYVD